MRVWLWALLIAVADQASKHWVRDVFALGESRPIIASVFHFTYLRNTGAAWSMLGGQNLWLAALSVVVLAVMVIFRRAFLSDGWEHRLALGLLAGGILGNVCDRIKLGYVTDFLDFFWHGHHFPVFNVADSAICVGVFLYVLSSLWVAGHPLNDQALKTSSHGGNAT
ncbi:MAG: signal peptidase II [Verrucomicrobia bacterium]|nr:MAG: signal peptidase II [Verrucomicrobiota bacterium]